MHPGAWLAGYWKHISVILAIDLTWDREYPKQGREIQELTSLAIADY
jgi:hypothetical protein